jgi:hypothetical protein
MDETKARIQTDAELDAQIDAWREKYKDQGDDNEPLAKSAAYVPRLKILIVELTNGRRLALPIEDLQGLENATAKQLRNIELFGLGTGITFPDIDAGFYVPALIEGVYGNRRWMAELGKKGGSAKTEAKQAASRANGAKGGRPRKVVSSSAVTRATALFEDAKRRVAEAAESVAFVAGKTTGYRVTPSSQPAKPPKHRSK